ncbi:MAG: hypothetical protein DWQ02_28505 [Bacteroidetes bacterium]|nr:MAG: hypothetical protein DWQ02_28505 [Bacteroidota bacterium]
MAMNLNKFFLIAAFLLGFFGLKSQDWTIHLNGNETYPIGNDQLGQYPILWYSSTEGRGVLVGGFGLGVSYRKPLNDQLNIKLQLNGQRSRFYDEPTIFTDFNGAPLGGIIGINTNLNISALAIPSLSITPGKAFNLGLGLGARGVLWSRTDYGVASVNGVETELKLKNKSLAPFVLLLPVEASWTSGRFSVATRAEFSITKTTRLSNKNDRSFILFIELGYRIAK